MHRAALLAILILAVAAVAAEAQRPDRPGQPTGPSGECPNGESGFESQEECEAALREQGWTQNPDGSWAPPPGYRNEEGGAGGGTRSLALAKSMRLRSVLRRGVTLKLTLSSGTSVKARLLLKRRTIGRASKSLSAGTRRLRLRLSRRGKRALARTLARRRKVKLTVKVAGDMSASRSLVVKR